MNGVSNTNSQIEQLVSWIIIVAGSLVLLSGIYLGFLTFNEAQSILHDPAPLKKWIDLQHNIQSTSHSQISESLSSHIISNTTSNLIHSAGGYILLFLSLLFLWILARIAIVLISKGGEIMLHGAKSLKSKINPNQHQ